MALKYKKLLLISEIRYPLPYSDSLLVSMRNFIYFARLCITQVRGS